MSSVPLRSRSPFFAFDAETGSRRPRWAAFVAGLLVLLLAGAGIVLGVSAASAHVPTIKADCYSLKVQLTQYNGTNSVYVSINGEVKADQPFGNGYTQTFTFDDPTVVNTWTVIVTAHDDPQFTKGWSVKKENQTTTPCAAPNLALTGTVCNTVGGTTTLTATISDLVAGQTYTGRLFKNGQQIDQFTATTAGKQWTGQEAGVTYRLTVTSDQQPGLSKSFEATIVGCPQNSDLTVTANQCTATGASNASVSIVASSLVPGRSYVARLHQNGAPYGGFEVAFTAGAGETSKSLSIGSIPANLTGLTVVLTDTAAGTTVESTGFSTNPCPGTPDTPQVTVQQCTTVGGALELTVTLNGLVPTRTYQVLVNDVPVGAPFTASSSSEGPTTYGVAAAGTYTVKVVDTLVPAVLAASDPIDVHDCPTQPDVALSAAQCDVPGGSGSLTATFSGLGAGREYLVTITAGAGSAVVGYETPITVTSASAPQVYSGLQAGVSYTVSIADKLLPGVKDAASETLHPCPLTPGIVLDLRCLLVEDESLVTATISDLSPGAQYQVDVIATTPPPTPVVRGTSVRAVAVIHSETITAGTDPTQLTFQVPNNVNYTVTVTHLSNSAITNSASIFAAVCDLPTFPLPELPTLALTGAGDTTMPMLGALGLVQFGVALLALAAMMQFAPRRRTT